MSRIDLHGDFTPDSGDSSGGSGCGAIIIVIIVGGIIMAFLCDISRAIGHCIPWCGCK